MRKNTRRSQHCCLNLGLREQGELVNLAQLSGQVQGAAMGRTAYAIWSRENYGVGSENVGATDGGFNFPATAVAAYVCSTCSISEREA